ncbi:6,7-dimethyl-8-ribityllumazine synthase [Novipirellula artificiosorum]|uniref:6,7-dimethyl-8-ribityllumazine synthase n=1 Tax=Novipirellula artificiosorum TaxID=2528016 RepID=A0A5C6E0U0_9BACT|nr:6,7-dimethyl-8-ribityllumazine synthase [Novipirellula artificiosorum]TWU42335.1 6,7-dimethyl-8-ribityllumazine synthase [Novipirellula artificiosorum]
MSIERTGLDGKLPKGRIAIIASRYNPAICDSLVKAAVATLCEAGVDSQSIVVVRVPGAWELPLVARKMIDKAKVIGVVTLGCVIKGETTHDEHINRAVSLSLMQLSIETRIPIGFGLLTCNTVEQALQRSGGNVGNKGEEAAGAVIEILRLDSQL